MNTQSTNIKCPGNKRKCDRKLVKQFWGGDDWMLLCTDHTCGYSIILPAYKVEEYERLGKIDEKNN